MGFQNWSKSGFTKNTYANLLVVGAGQEATVLDIQAINWGLYNARVELAIFDSTLTPLTAPTNLLVTQNGTTGTTTYMYKVTALNERGETIGSVAESISNGNATLDATNNISLSWDSVAGATRYRIYGRTSTDEYSLIDEVTETIYTDDDSTYYLDSRVKPPFANTTTIHTRLFPIDMGTMADNSADSPYFFSMQKKVFLGENQILKALATQTDVDVCLSGEII